MKIIFDQFEIERLAKYKLLQDGMTPAEVAKLVACVRCNHKTKAITLVMESPKPIEIKDGTGKVVSRVVLAKP